MRRLLTLVALGVFSSQTFAYQLFCYLEPGSRLMAEYDWHGRGQPLVNVQTDRLELGRSLFSREGIKVINMPVGFEDGIGDKAQVEVFDDGLDALAMNVDMDGDGWGDLMLTASKDERETAKRIKSDTLEDGSRRAPGTFPGTERDIATVFTGIAEQSGLDASIKAECQYYP